MVSRFSRWPPKSPSWTAKWNDLSNALSLHSFDASHQVSAQSNFWFERCHLKNFKMAIWWPSWTTEQNNFSNSNSVCFSDISHQVLAQSHLQFGKRC